MIMAGYDRHSIENLFLVPLRTHTNSPVTESNFPLPVASDGHVSGSRGGDLSRYGILRYDAVYFGRHVSPLRRRTLQQSSWF
jgi:hypothetical protein